MWTQIYQLFCGFSYYIPLHNNKNNDKLAH